MIRPRLRLLQLRLLRDGLEGINIFLLLPFCGISLPWKLDKAIKSGGKAFISFYVEDNERMLRHRSEGQLRERILDALKTHSLD